MSDLEKLLRDIDTLRESIRLNGLDLVRTRPSPAEKAGILLNSKLCMQDLSALLDRLSSLPDPK